MLGDRLKELRSSKGLSQEELSKQIGITRGTYAHYEINKRQPDYETLHKLADFFKVTTDYLLGRPSNQFEEFMDKEVVEESYKDELLFISYVRRFFHSYGEPGTPSMLHPLIKKTIVDYLKEGRYEEADQFFYQKIISPNAFDNNPFASKEAKIIKKLKKNLSFFEELADASDKQIEQLYKLWEALKIGFEEESKEKKQ